MQRTTQAQQHQSLGKTLKDLLGTENQRGLSIQEITTAVGEKGFGLLLVVLSLPSALPVPAPGYSTPFGIVIALVALQLSFSRRTLWLPRMLANIRIKPKLAHSMLSSASNFLLKIEHYIKPRQRWIRSRLGQLGLSIVIIIMAFLMMLPVPLTNTFPAIVIFIIGVGLAEEDGLLALGAFFIGCFALFLYAGIIYLVLTQGAEAIEPIRDLIKSFLSIS